MTTWAYRVAFSALLGGMFVGAYGCTDECGDRLTCSQPNTALGPVMIGGENCQNGKDDDKNGSVDCEDSKCANLVVCNVRNDGWQYQTITMDVFAAKPIPDCADGNKAERLYEGHKGQPSCEECTCAKSNAQGPLVCEGFGELECTSDFQDQATTWTPITTNSDGSCQIPAGLETMTHCRLPAAVNIARDSCIASGGALVDEPAWTQEVFSCPMAQNARTDEAGACLRQDGDIATCPDGYGNRTVVYKSETGTRACTACNCTGECTPRITVYGNDGCTNGGAVHVEMGTPRDVENFVKDNVYSIKKVAPIPPSDCLPIGGEAVEEVLPAEPVTICCK